MMRALGIMALILVASACKRCEVPPPSPGVEETLGQIAAQGAALREISFKKVIEATTGRRVMPIDPQDPIATALLRALGQAADDASATLSAESSPVRRLRRINEASRHFEDQILRLLDSRDDFSCEYPPTESGGSQRAGYPDLKITHTPSGRIAYLDPKLFQAGSQNSSFRSFYYEPKTETNKVLEDAHHLLLGIGHDGRDGEWQFTTWQLVDLSKLKVRLKPEFQASNRDLYGEGAILSSGE